MTSHFPSYFDLIRPSSRKHAILFDFLMILSGSSLLALASQISVHVPFSPVPITAQTLAVLLIGVSMGSKRGALTILAYLSQGAAGLPVFAGGLSGIAYMVGPTGGYLLGFLPASYIAGLCAENGYDRKVLRSFALMITGNAIIYIFGLIWLAFYVDKNMVLKMGLYPFLLGDLLKIVIASLALPAGWILIKRK